MAEVDDVITGMSTSEITSSVISVPNDVILDSTDPYESLTVRTSTNNSENRDDLLNGDGDVGLLELAVEAQPDLVFESDLVSLNINADDRDQQQQLPFVRPRVYLERESFSYEDSLSQTANVCFFFCLLHTCLGLSNIFFVGLSIA